MRPSRVSEQGLQPARRDAGHRLIAREGMAAIVKPKILDARVAAGEPSTLQGPHGSEGWRARKGSVHPLTATNEKLFQNTGRPTMGANRRAIRAADEIESVLSDWRMGDPPKWEGRARPRATPFARVSFFAVLHAWASSIVGQFPENLP